MIRAMQLKDVEEIKEIDKLCFKANAKRTNEGIIGYIEAGNNSSIVYEVNNKVVGFNFIHIWGSFAWFGPLGVHPEYQSKGIGRELINHTIKILAEDYKVLTIGLYTMPESQYNVGFYMNLGFTPLKLSLNLKKQIDFSSSMIVSHSNQYNVNEIDIGDEKNYLLIKENLKSISNKTFNNFDLASELYLIKNHGFGTIFTLEFQNKIQGIAICYMKSIREDLQKNFQIKLAIINSNVDYRKAIDSIINFCANYAQNIKYESISIDCNTYNKEICNYLISKHKFKIEKTQVMLLKGEINLFKSENVILLTRLAG
jgi:ribosomal protein S18 acetylase RimI-like enzyme